MELIAGREENYRNERVEETLINHTDGFSSELEVRKSGEGLLL